mmetsp:Transcript_25810/g.72271  ORF Transcript_25810/g.72271 Transcript_25810/m.72271 type:complete len:511 (+) Transcript_25810:298-1830(+)|eukprot:CAMPEP_0117658714 /NCGR_PEP_ID=MMETSP0804-20121206/6011_1 /TAXON_ID=1074897 /ORGANISM="Tetraselmis astigmatica, Strain CCMP880" /LENGTH=510 /DNA_ID=CAMNT_0005465253 /DNA_START=361 /DNA_END=1893 /DNA_ORIENTATION=+
MSAGQHQSLHVSLEPITFPSSSQSCKDKAEWLLKQQASNALPLLTELKYFDLTAGPLAKMLGGPERTGGTCIKYAYMNPESGSSAATISWRVSFTLPDVSTADLSTYLESGKLRKVSKHFKFLQAPGSCTSVKQLQDVSTRKRSAMLLYSEHWCQSDSKGLFPEAAQYSQLRVVFPATQTEFSNGGTLIIEAPATHSSKQLHTSNLLFANDRRARAAELWRQGEPVPIASINLYHIQAQESGVKVTIYIAENVHKGSAIHVPIEMTDCYGYGLNLVKTLAQNTTKYVDSEKWQETVEMIRAVQQQAAMENLDGFGLDDDMKAFVQDLVSEGYEEMQDQQSQEAKKKAEAEAVLETLHDQWGKGKGKANPFVPRDDDISFVSFDTEQDPHNPEHSGSSDLRASMSAPNGSGLTPSSLQRSATENASSRAQGKTRAKKSEPTKPTPSTNPLEPVGEFFGNLMKGMQESLVERGETVTRVNKKTAKMEDSAEGFADAATRLRKEMEAKPWWQR